MQSTFKILLALAASCTVYASANVADCGSTMPASSANESTLSDPNLLSDLLHAPTAIDRARRLLVNGDSLRTGDDLSKRIVFDFNMAQPAAGATGRASKAANITTYPFSVGLDLSLTVLFLEPCGINTPHLHPRAAEFLILVEGSNLRFGTVLEDGLVKAGNNQEIAGTLNKLHATAFPQGSMHWQFNDSCEKALVVAALNSGNPGTNRIAQNFLSLNAQVVNATLGVPNSLNGQSVQDFRGTIPANLAQDIGSCLARCGPRD